MGQSWTVPLFTAGHKDVQVVLGPHKGSRHLKLLKIANDSIPKDK